MKRSTLAVLIGLLLAVVLPLQASATAERSEDPVLAQLQPRLQLLANRVPGRVAVSITNLNDGEAISINGNWNMPAASVIKIPVMVEVFHQLELGRFTMKRTVMLLDQDRDCGFGSLCDAPWGTQVSVRELLWRMIAASDNTATNMLVRLVGRTNVNQMMEDLGLDTTRMGDEIHSWGDIRSLRTSADDMMHLLTDIAAHRVVSDRADDLMLGILAGQRHNTLLPQPLPRGTIVEHKTGTLSDTLNDVGIVELPGSPYVICVLTTNLGDLDDGERFIRAVSRLTYQTFASNM